MSYEELLTDSAWGNESNLHHMRMRWLSISLTLKTAFIWKELTFIKQVWFEKAVNTEDFYLKMPHWVTGVPLNLSMLMSIICEKCADWDDKTEKTKNKYSLPLLSCDWKWAVLSSLGPGRSNGYLKTGYMRCWGMASSGTLHYFTQHEVQAFYRMHFICLLSQMFLIHLESIKTTVTPQYVENFQFSWNLCQWTETEKCWASQTC